MSLKIIKYPHPTLRHKSKSLRRVDAELRKMIEQMLEMMYENNGVGLAGNQVDLPYRLFVMNLQCDPEAKEEEMVFLNPTITKRSGMVEMEEGCLSFPEIWAPVKRPERVEMAAYTLDGKEVRLKLDKMAARAVQHEIDHLDGVTFVERLAPTAQLEVKETLTKLERAFHSDRERGAIPDDETIFARLAELEKART